MVELERRLADFGLYPRGGLRLDAAELEACGVDAGRAGLLLVGNIGSSYWPLFSRSPEFADGLPDPLDRWSRRVAETVAGEFELTPLYPFAGPPWLPFQRWAARAEGLAASPLGIMAHPEHGLWHSWRFALAGVADAAPVDLGDSPCLACSARPCLSTCPAGAVTAAGYDVDACADWLLSTARAECHGGGCLARLACPLAPGLRYRPAQGAFHLAAFLAAR